MQIRKGENNCNYPDHGTPVCSPHDLCDFDCRDGYTKYDGKCVCLPPYEECGGQCGTPSPCPSESLGKRDDGKGSDSKIGSPSQGDPRKRDDEKGNPGGKGDTRRRDDEGSKQSEHKEDLRRRGGGGSKQSEHEEDPHRRDDEGSKHSDHKGDPRRRGGGGSKQSEHEEDPHRRDDEGSKQSDHKEHLRRRGDDQHVKGGNHHEGER